LHTGTGTKLACLLDQSKSGFLEGQPFFSQSGIFENFSDFSDWLDKSWPSKKGHFCFDCVNRLNMSNNFMQFADIAYAYCI